MLARVVDEPFVFTDQGQRWAAWKRIYELDLPKDGSPEAFAQQMVVPRDTGTGDRYVLASWVQTYLRRYGLRENPSEIANLLGHLGWRSRGKTGRIKATEPGGANERGMAFYIVPGGWERPEWSSET